MIQKEMLTYQDLDKELNRIERELRKNDYFIKRKKLKAMQADYEDKLTKLDQKALELKNQLAAARALMQKITNFILEQNKEITEVESESELNYMSKKLAENMEALASVENDIKRILKEGEEVARNFEAISAELPKIIAGIKKCNEEFAKATEAAKPRVTEIKQQQAELRKLINPALFDKYKKLSESQIHPVFVPLQDGVRCGGCRMEMPRGVVESKMQGNGYMVCEHCGRIIYQAE